MILLFYKSEGLRESIAFGQHFDIARHMSNNSEAFNVTINQCTHCLTEKQHCQASAPLLTTIWKWFQCQKFSGNVWLTYVGFLSLVRIYSGRSRPGHPTLKFISLSQFIAAEVKYASISKKVILNSSFEERCKKYWKGHVVLECDNM